jgi:hypothetical protein
MDVIYPPYELREQLKVLKNQLKEIASFYPHSCYIKC